MTNGLTPKRSLLAVASLASALMLFFPPAWVAAMVLAIVALVEIKQSGGTLRGRGMAVAALVLSILWIALLTLFVVQMLAASREDLGGYAPPGEEYLDESLNAEPPAPPTTPVAPAAAGTTPAPATSTDNTAPATSTPSSEPPAKTQ